MTPTLGIVGAGHVGSALARLLAAHGWRVAAVYSRTPAHAAGLAEAVGALPADSPSAVLAAADLTLLTVPDDAIAPLADTMAAAVAATVTPPRAVVHTSGALGADVLAPLAARGLRTGSLHPAFPFAVPAPSLAGAAFAVEAADDGLRADLLALVAALGGVPLIIPHGGKAQYHAALCIASNYAVTLYAIAERLLTGLGIPADAADSGLNSLMAGTVENLRLRGLPNALTGPLVRADVGTLQLHLRALRRVDPALVAVYSGLARQTYPLLQARGVAITEIERLLKEEETHAPDRA
ncbi:MAG TPA: DUF2520 domain-containing protein [Candidatus Limnocylindrales bacterium]|nr:DUF2520 domain-containing protein [Candidatus Limnocylindrales bacterium]